MDATIISFADNNSLASHIANQLNAVYTIAKTHEFPDGESCVRIDPSKIREMVFVIHSLYHPDQLLLPLLFLAETLRDYKARKIVLIAPYLAYMRQDMRFNEGEGISAKYFAKLISGYFDSLITVDPHLHRIKQLEEIYSISTRIIHAAPLVAEWIHKNIKLPLLIGPDSESEQWIHDLANQADAEFILLEKTRHGDRSVEISVPDVSQWQEHTPVLFDDIISTGKTMIETIKHLKKTDLAAPVCIGVHGIFSGNAYQELIAAGADKVVTTNTIEHLSNEINIAIPIVQVINQSNF
jgi:ribose-phosphate pyrophosphokinase